MVRRLAEVARLGFKKCIVPKTSAKLRPPPDLEIVIAGTLREAVFKGLGKRVEGKGEEEDEG
jgi:predicted ATP-dependent serine protease